jgi:uncharacterized protein (UPF0548 family)
MPNPPLVDPAPVPVTYAAVGSTRAPDLLTHPPQGFRGSQVRSRIGHGDARWEFACQQTMSWGIQRRAGFRVVATAQATRTPLEQVFSSDGHAMLRPGDDVELVALGLRSPVRVIYLVEEPTRRGFAYGTLPGHPECGEESFVVDQTEDGSVWMTVRSFSRPSSRRWWALYPMLRLAQAIITKRYLRALSVPID